MEKEPLILTQGTIDALEFQANLAHQAITRAITTDEYIDIIPAVALYGTVLPGALMEASGYRPCMDFTRGTPEADFFDRYTLQYAIGEITTILLKDQLNSKKHGHQPQPVRTSVTIQTFTTALENKTTPYSDIYVFAQTLTNSHQLDAIVNAFDYIKNTHPIPEPTTLMFDIGP
jgi:hypothetical protein